DWPTTPVTEGSANLSISPADGSGTSFEFDADESVSIEFEISGDQGHAVSVALIDAPSGATLSGANSSSPTFRWSSPRKGTHSFKFLLRDMDACKEAEGSLSKCELSSSVSGKEGSYDVLSSRYSLEIGTGSSTDLDSD